METDTIERDDLLLHRGGFEVRVMAVADNWLMVRRKGCAPFLMDMRAAKELPLAKKAHRPKGWKVTVAP